MSRGPASLAAQRSLLASALIALLSSCSGGSVVPCAQTAPTPPLANLPDVSTNSSATAAKPAGSPSVEETTAFVAGVDANLRKVWLASERTSWVAANFITDDTEVISATADEASMEYLSRIIPQSTRYLAVKAPPLVHRQLERLRFSSSLAAPADEKLRAELARLSASMQGDYGKKKYCPTKPQGQFAKMLAKASVGQPKPETCLSLDQLGNILEQSRDEGELREAWLGWHATAAPMRPKYERYTELGNKGAREIGFKDMGDMWRSRYDMAPDDFEKETERLWQQVKPLYDELHCYTRKRLTQQYGKDKIGPHAPIPAHLLGNMWAQEWQALYPLLEPYKGQPSLDVTAALKSKNYDEKKMVQLGEAFFVSLGFEPLPKSFWERSLMKRPKDRDVQCHASAWDLDKAGDVRLKMCVEIKEEDLITIHHELGHIFYYLQYENLPVLLQEGANDGFHEGIGDTLALSVTPGYLKSLGLLQSLPQGDKGEINVLLKKALEKVAFLPFGKLIDQWRWDVYDGKTPPAKYNEAWWALKLKYQGVAPPSARTEADFDPGAKYHVASGTPYMRYFLAAIYQFQFHRALCRAAGHQGPLTTCSIFGSKEAGAKLKAMLAMGASRPWPEALEALSGEKQADATAMLEYFEPLRKFLREQTTGEQCGW